MESGLPILGICYGQQSLMHQLGGEVLLGGGRIWPRLYRDRTLRAVQRPVVDWRKASGVDEPWRQGHRCPRFPPVASSPGAPLP
jgi:GMP synthase (glutamine-hydrolysing)